MDTTHDATQGTVEVRGFFSLAPVVGGTGTSLVDTRCAPTVAALAAHLGLDHADLGMIMVNGCKALPETPLASGDRVAFFPAYVPYHKAYGMCIL